LGSPGRSTGSWLLAFLVAFAVGPRPPAASLAVHDFATLTEREARQLAGRPALFRVVLDSEPDGDGEHGWRYERKGAGDQLRLLWLPDGDDLVAAQAAKGSGLLLVVVATLRRIVHPPITGETGGRCRRWSSTGWCGRGWWTGSSGPGGGRISAAAGASGSPPVPGLSRQILPGVRIV
jgi:hypothetical protein